MTTKEVLQAARDYIVDPKKWTQGKLERHDGAVCSAGAILKIEPKINLRDDPVIDTLASILPRVPGVRSGSHDENISKVTHYNDHHDHHCVIAAFDAAIERAES